jgi:LysM repeat protein
MSAIASASTASASTAVSSTTHLHLTQRGRVVFTALAAVPLVVGSLLIALNGGMAAATNDHAAPQFTYVTVSAGESLWQLAEEIAPTADPRDVVADIVNLNQLSSEEVQPGQRLALPVSR